MELQECFLTTFQARKSLHPTWPWLPHCLGQTVSSQSHLQLIFMVLIRKTSLRRCWKVNQEAAVNAPGIWGFLGGWRCDVSLRGCQFVCFFLKKKKPARVKEDQERWSRLLQFKCHFFFFLTLFFNIIWVHFYFYEIWWNNWCFIEHFIPAFEEWNWSP